MITRRSLSLTFISILWLMLFNSKTANAKNFADIKELKVGISPTSPPIQYKHRNEITGLEADFAKGFADYLGRKLVFVELDFKNLIPSLLTEDIDIIMSGMTITRIRSLQIAFTDPYIRVGQMALVRAEDKNKFLSPMDIVMTNKRVATKRNTTGEYLIVQEFPNAKAIFFNTTAQGEKILLNKKADLVILDSPYIWDMAGKNEGKLAPIPIYLTDERLAWGIKKSNTNLIESANIFLIKMKENGELDDILTKWMPFYQKGE